MSSSDGGEVGADGHHGTVIWEGRPSCIAACGAYLSKKHYLITTSYIEIERGICCKSIDNVQLIRVQDLSYKQCCCCSCGTIEVISSDKTHEVLTIKGIPGGRQVFEKLRNAHQDRMTNAKLELDI